MSEYQCFISDTELLMSTNYVESYYARVYILNVSLRKRSRYAEQ